MDQGNSLKSFEIMRSPNTLNARAFKEAATLEALLRLYLANERRAGGITLSDCWISFGRLAGHRQVERQ